MTNGLIKHMTVEESTRIQWVKQNDEVGSCEAGSFEKVTKSTLEKNKKGFKVLPFENNARSDR